MPFDSIPDAQVTARDRLIRLRDFLAELPPEKFDMQSWGAPECGTAACIGGWADSLFAPSDNLSEAAVGKLIGLSEDTYWDLFYMKGDISLGAYFQTPTPTQAVRVLDHLLATSSPGTCDGVVDWGRMGER